MLLIIFFFLRNFRATLIPLVTIPVSLIGAFALMFMLGFTINTLTLLALVLAIGLVVDDAIVMLENITVTSRKACRACGRRCRVEGNRLRGGRDDHHARRRVRAGGVHDWPHRQALRRVRADAGRRSDRLRLRRADPVADDVLAAAPARNARPRLRCCREFLQALTAGYKRLLTASLAHRWAFSSPSCWSPVERIAAQIA